MILAFPGNESLAARLGGPVHPVQVHRFPDGESLVRIDADVKGASVDVVCTLDHPDPKLFPLVVLLRTLRELGAARIRLVAPYLCYMRQDRRFHPGEGVSAPVLASMLGPLVDGLVTVDPHLHRIPSLDALWPRPVVVHAAPALAAWVAEHVRDPLFIGPDEESAQWVEAVAHLAGAPSTVLRKERRGDRDVAVSVPELERWPGRTPVLVDDIASTARTLAAAAAHLRRLGTPPPACVVVHGLFAEGAAEALIDAGVGLVASTNTVIAPTSVIDIAPLLARALAPPREGV